ncbi:hypothetical protein HDV00_003898 [Rhizophlyctis rosea]|nr:hypothetical protein HDV00_003898 [Rhizophlyctis rosea]
MVQLDEEWNLLPGEVIVENNNPAVRLCAGFKNDHVQQVMLTNYRIIAKKRNFVELWGIPLSLFGWFDNEYVQAFWVDVSGVHLGLGKRKLVHSAVCFLVALVALILYLYFQFFPYTIDSTSNAASVWVAKNSDIKIAFLAIFAIFILLSMMFHMKRPTVLQFFVSGVGNEAFQIKGPRDKLMPIWKSFHEINGMDDVFGLTFYDI